jgi:hypothetical protein
MLIGSLVSGRVVDMFKTADGHDWGSLWYVPAVAAAAVALLFGLVFRDDLDASPARADASPAYAAPAS